MLATHQTAQAHMLDSSLANSFQDCGGFEVAEAAYFYAEVGEVPDLGLNLSA